MITLAILGAILLGVIVVGIALLLAGGISILFTLHIAACAAKHSSFIVGTSAKEFVDKELKQVDQQLWEKKASNIYFRKKLNYKTGNDIYIIRPNQRRFWSQSMALEDASELILEILNGN